jgi:hypothetical protein
MKILTACINALLIFFYEWWTFKQDPLPCKYPGLALATISLITLRKNSLLAIQLNGAESQFSQRRLVFGLHPQLVLQCKN